MTGVNALEGTLSRARSHRSSRGTATRVVAASALEHIDEFAGLGQTHGAILRRVAREPPTRRAVIPLRVIVADEQDETERIGQVDMAELAGRGEREVRVPGLNDPRAMGQSVVHRRFLARRNALPLLARGGDPHAVDRAENSQGAVSARPIVCDFRAECATNSSSAHAGNHLSLSSGSTTFVRRTYSPSSTA